ncbi:MAG TPA: GlsB/YeaQ/YmgE family stress response membrane protein [Methylomirabilota bacterium]|nr:GlsB/YeaQ/YmgE family stress response membrane protein [Methylomirabilota bacterium]
MTFLTWILAGVLAGLLAGWIVKRGSYGLNWDLTLGLVGSIGGSWLLRSLGFYPGAGIVATAVVAFIVAVIPIVAQRKFFATERAVQKKDAYWRWGLGAGLVALVAWMTLGPVQQPAAVAAAIEEKTYAVMPASLQMKAGIVTGEVSDMKVAERVEKGSDRIVTAAKLTGMLKLKNTSANQTVRLLDGKLLYIDAQGQPIKLEDGRTEPTFKFAAYGSSERLDPGQEAIQSLDVEFPTEALKDKRLKQIRLEFAYIPSPYREETVNFAVSIGAAK